MDMHTRIHACLDGDLPREELSAGERAQLDAIERDLASSVLAARSIPAIDLRAGVLERLVDVTIARPWHEQARTSVTAAWSWFWAPRQVTFQLRPSFALAAILALSLLPLAVFRGDPMPTAYATADAEARRVLVQFRLDAPHATSVALAGSFSEWEPAIELRESAPGVWTATVPLRPGVHDYLFLVDAEEWVADPSAHPVDDDFGGVNSRLLLTIPSSSL
jgi:hypothetical protein